MMLLKRLQQALIATTLVAGLPALCACAPLGVPGTSASVGTLQATPDVRQALAPSGRLRVAVYPGSPTSWVKNPQTGQSAGIAYELGHVLAQQLGVPVEVVTFARVAEILDALKAGQVDMTFTNATAVRAKDVDFTAPLVQLELGLLVPPGSDIHRFADADQANRRIGVSLGSSSQSALGQRLQQARVVTATSLEAAQQLFKQGEIDAFATNKGILFEMSEKLPGYRVLDDRWGLENLAIAVPKGREAGRAFLQNFAEQMQRGGQLTAMAQRAGLRGLANP
jgi:polar amino acid transport system substrate-binding protein